jgi:PBSX family phage terminase large subunit
MGKTKRRSDIDIEAVRAETGYRIVFEPRNVIKDLFTMKDEEILVAGPAGTGKSLGVLQKIHLVLSKYPNSKGFMCRKTRVSMTNSCIATFDNKVLAPPDKVHFHKTDQHYQYPNGSILAVVGLDEPSRIMSTEWDIGYVQEATECLENDWEMCTTRLRNWIVPYQQMLADCNPDKPSHWLKKRCESGKMRMLLSKHEDNPRLWDEKAQQWTQEGRIYLGKLSRLSGVRRARLYSGEWVAAEGAVYPEWDKLIHVINWQHLPKGWEDWPHIWAIDFGFIHPFCWQDWIENPDTGDIYRVREIYKTKRLVEDHARHIMDITSGVYTPQAVICDHDAEDRATFERHTGYLTLPAYKPIQSGIQAVQKRIKNAVDNALAMKSGGTPVGKGMYLVSDALVERDDELFEAGLPTCTEEEVDGYVWDKRVGLVSNSKKDELPVDKDNHGCDAKRYVTAFIDNLSVDPEDFEEYVTYTDEVNISNW